MLTLDTGRHQVDIRVKLQDVIDDPSNCDVPRVMRDAIYIIDQLEQERDAAQKMADLTEEVLRETRMQSATPNME